MAIFPAFGVSSQSSESRRFMLRLPFQPHVGTFAPLDWSPQHGCPERRQAIRVRAVDDDVRYLEAGFNHGYPADSLENAYRLPALGRLCEGQHGRYGALGRRNTLCLTVGAGTQSGDGGVIRDGSTAHPGDARRAVAVLVVGCGASGSSIATTSTTRPSTAASPGGAGERLGLHAMAYPASNRVRRCSISPPRSRHGCRAGKPTDVVMMFFSRASCVGWPACATAHRERT